MKPSLITEMASSLLYGPVTQVQMAQNELQKEKYILEGYKVLYEYNDFSILYARS